jgi:mannose-6-phosphate isomerase-like protein (cupin superfamily)
MFVFDGQQCPFHRHRDKHETFFLIRGRARLICDGQDSLVEPGAVLAVPPGREHSFLGVGPALLLELSMPCDVADNCFTDPAVAAWLGRCAR